MDIQTRAREAYNAAVEQRDNAINALDTITDAATPDEVQALVDAAEAAQATVERNKQELDRITRVVEARANTPILNASTSDASSTQTRSAGEIVFPAAAKGSLKVERAYRPDNSNGAFFIRDLVASSSGDTLAIERLQRNNAEVRDISTTSTAGGGFVPPLYMGELWAQSPSKKRPLADALGSRPLPSTGMSITLPRVTTAPATALQTSENSSLQETDLVEATVTTPVRTIGGIQDVSQQLLERSDPGIDAVIATELRNSYDAILDAQLLSGTGSSGQHTGLANVSGITYVAYTDASPTAAELHPKLYSAISTIASARYENPTHIVMHPRRSAWLAASVGTSFPLYPAAGSVQATGNQYAGFADPVTGLTRVLDPNVVTTYGAGTDQDRIYVICSDDLILFEGDLRFDVHPQTLSGALTTRLRLYAYSAFVSGRYPSGIVVIDGTGLNTPSF